MKVTSLLTLMQLGKNFIIQIDGRIFVNLIPQHNQRNHLDILFKDPITCTYLWNLFRCNQSVTNRRDSIRQQH